MLYRFDMNRCEGVGSKRTHTDYFERHGVDWTTAVWEDIRPASWSHDLATFTTIDGKCKACTNISYFTPYKPGPINLKDYM